MKTSEKAYAYTPGLKVKRSVIVSKLRKLPMKGDVLVKQGDQVSHEDIVAQGLVAGDPVIVNAAFELDVEPVQVKDCMLKKVGEEVRKGEIIAKSSFLFGLFKHEARSPIDGKIDLVSDLSGQVIVRGSSVKVSIDAYIPGAVATIIPNEGAAIETNAALIHGILGIGGEIHGKIRRVVDSPKEVLRTETIPDDCKGCVLVGGSSVTFDAIAKAVELGAAGIVSGGIEPVDLKKFYGRELGVAITGEEELGLTLIITEGFGEMPMSQRAFDLLGSFEGYQSSINGATQIRAGVVRPEIIIPHEEAADEAKDELDAGMVPGTIVRIIRQPYFGAIGTVHNLPVELQNVETESKVRVVEVELEGHRIVTVPRANVEIIEE